MSDTEIASQRLGRVDQRVLADARRRLERYDLTTQTEDFVLEAQLLASRLSEPLRRSLLTFRRFGHPSGGTLIRGVPLGPLPSTPRRVDVTSNTARSVGATMSVLVAQLGDQYGFKPEFGGAIIQDMTPVRGFETQQISLGSTVNLKTHVEMAFSPFRSDYVALLCIRQDHDRQAGTTLSAIEAILPLLDRATVDVLRQPRFRTKVDASFLIGGGHTKDIWMDPICVFEDGTRRPRLRVDFAETEGTDVMAQTALETLHKAAVRAQRVVRLEAGDLLIVDNGRALHGRTPFVPRYDGKDRWLLRSFITKDLRRSECVRPADGRTVSPDYDMLACDNVYVQV